MSLAWWNGRLVPLAEVRIDPGDPGFLMGDGLFETLRVDGGRAMDVDAHLDRLLAGLERIGIPLPEDLSRAVESVAEAAPRPVARMRITITRGKTRLITAAPYTPPSGRIDVILLPEPWIDSRSPLAGLKSLSYQANRLALARAERAGAFEALLLNERGRLAEGSRTNVLVRLSGDLVTPPLADGCLPGIVRRRLLESGLVKERSVDAEELRGAREILLTNSLIGVLPVGRIDGRALASSAGWCVPAAAPERGDDGRPQKNQTDHSSDRKKKQQ
ncbi:MAG TPA: aminotransferase class IV [Thermoanaerobaculia bacterium]|jgi:branched-chain amino acid aminotransferase|nr:aminotransferase class IV [Thermoanaerobaculia bacterium]